MTKCSYEYFCDACGKKIRSKGRYKLVMGDRDLRDVLSDPLIVDSGRYKKVFSYEEVCDLCKQKIIEYVRTLYLPESLEKGENDG